MAIQIVHGKLDTDPLLELGDSARYTKCVMTEEEANMSSGVPISLGRIKPASEQIDNGEYRPDTHTKPISLFERRNKWKSEYRPSSQSSTTPPRPMTLTRHPNIADEIDTSSNVRVSGPVDPIRPNIDTDMSSNVRVLGSVDELYAAISADESNNANVHNGANTSNNADMSSNVKVSDPVDDTHTSGSATACDNANVHGGADTSNNAETCDNASTWDDEDTKDDADTVKQVYMYEMLSVLQMTKHDRLMSGDLDRCDKFDKLYTRTNDIHHLFNKYSLLRKHLTNLEGDVGVDYLLQCVPNELIHLVASRGATNRGNTKKTIYSLDRRTRLLIWLTVTATEVWEKYLSDVDQEFCNVYNSDDMRNSSKQWCPESNPHSKGRVVKILLNILSYLLNVVKVAFSVRPQYLIGGIIALSVLLWAVTSLCINDGFLQWLWKPVVGFCSAAIMTGYFQAWWGRS